MVVSFSLSFSSFLFFFIIFSDGGACLWLLMVHIHIYICFITYLYIRGYYYPWKSVYKISWCLSKKWTNKKNEANFPCFLFQKLYVWWLRTHWKSITNTHTQPYPHKHNEVHLYTHKHTPIRGGFFVYWRKNCNTQSHHWNIYDTYKNLKK